MIGWSSDRVIKGSNDQGFKGSRVQVLNGGEKKKNK